MSKTETKKKTFRSLAVTLVITFSTVSLVILLIAIASEMYFNFQTQRSVIASQQQVIAQEAANTVRSFVEDKFSKMETTVNLGNLANVGQEEQALALERLLGREPAFRQLALLDAQKQETTRVSRVLYSAPGLSAEQINEIFSRLSQGGRYISSIFIDQNTSEPLIILAVPILDVFGDFKGILMAETNLKFMWDLVGTMKIGNTGLAYVVDRQGNLIAFGDISRVLARENLTPLSEVNKFVNNGGLPTGDLTIMSKGILGTYVATTYVPLGTPDWAVVTELPLLEAYGSLIWNFILSIVIMLMSCGLVIAVSIYFSRRITKPIIKLRDAAIEIGGGKLDTKIEVEAKDEIGELAFSFNQMTKNLQESRVDLEKYSKELEKRVEERTKELTSQRDELYQMTIALVQTREKQEQALGEATEAKSNAEEARIASLNILEDIEEARKAQELEKNKIEAVLRSLTDGVIMLDQFGWVSLMNVEAEAMLNVKKEDIISKRLGEIENASIKKINEALQGEEGPIEKKEIELKGPAERILEINTALVVGIDKKVLGQVIILHDITREKAIDKMKTEFVTIAAHQLRTPLSAVKWTLRLILDQDLGPISKEQSETLEKGYQSNERMISLVNDLLNITRIEEGRFIYGFIRISIVDLIVETIDSFQTLAKMKNIKLKFEKPKTVIEVMADKEKIKLAVQNLIENALNYSPSGSDVTISLDCDKMNLTLGVKDKGMGILKKQQERVFTKFFRGDNAVRMETEGTGLGLFLTKNIIEKHGGKIWFETEENKGSTFYFTLPLAK